MSFQGGSLVDLPLEIFRLVLEYAVQARNLKRALRLRLVSKTFSDEIIEALISTKAMDNCRVSLSRIPFSQSYMEQRVLRENTATYPKLNLIRRVAELLATEKGDMQYREYVSRHVSLTFIKCPTSRLSRYFEKRPLNQVTKFAGTVVNVSSFMNYISLVREYLPSSGRPKCSTNGRAMGLPFSSAIYGGNIEILSLFMSLTNDSDAMGRYSKLRLASKAGLPVLVDFILKSDWSPLKLRYLSTREWRPITLNSQAIKVAEINKSLATPSLEAFALLLKEREALDPGPLPKYVLFALICKAAKSGWTEMTKHLLALQAPLDDPIQFEGGPVCGNRTASQLEQLADPPLLHACREGFHEIAELLLNSGANIQGREICAASGQGHSKIVKMLLQRGADVRCAKSLTAAAGKGYLGIVRLLLDAGMDPNQGSPSPVVLAVELEHHAMYSLLVERGANIRAPKVWSGAMKVINENGLLSMAKMLQSDFPMMERICSDA